MAVLKPENGSELPNSSSPSKLSEFPSSFDHLRAEEPLSKESLLTLLKLSQTRVFEDVVSFKLQSGAHYSCVEYLEAHDRELFNFLATELCFRIAGSFCGALTFAIPYDLAQEINHLKAISDAPTKALLDDVIPGCNGRLYLDGKEENFMVPNIRFSIRGQFPGVIIETAWSKSYTELSKRAQTLLTRTGGDVQVFLGIKSNYRKGDTLTVYSWRSENGVISVKEDTVFHRGTTFPGAIKLSVRDFANPAALAKYNNADLDAQIALKYDHLVEIFKKLEGCRGDVSTASSRGLRNGPPASRSFSTAAVSLCCPEKPPKRYEKSKNAHLENATSIADWSAQRGQDNSIRYA